MIVLDYLKLKLFCNDTEACLNYQTWH